MSTAVIEKRYGSFAEALENDQDPFAHPNFALFFKIFSWVSGTLFVQFLRIQCEFWLRKAQSTWIQWLRICLVK